MGCRKAFFGDDLDGRMGRLALWATAAAIFLSTANSFAETIERRAFLDQFIDSSSEPGEYAEGVLFDSLVTPDEFERLALVSRAAIPRPTTEIRSPLVVVSLAGLTARISDTEGSFTKVYPVGVGVRRKSDRRSITPVGDFSTHRDPRDRWHYMWERWNPDYFGGLPFVRLDARNSQGQMTYGLHGPITTPLERGYVSHGCVRMRGEDVKELFAILYHAAPARVLIQQEADYNEFGVRYDVDYPVLPGVDVSAPKIRVVRQANLAVQVVTPDERSVGENFRLRAVLRGEGASEVQQVVFNEGARWDGTLGGPVPVVGQEAHAVHSFDSPGNKEIHAIALDRERQPVAYGTARIAVRAPGT